MLSSHPISDVIFALHSKASFVARADEKILLIIKKFFELRQMAAELSVIAVFSVTVCIFKRYIFQILKNFMEPLCDIL